MKPTIIFVVERTPRNICTNRSLLCMLTGCPIPFEIQKGKTWTDGRYYMHHTCTLYNVQWSLKMAVLGWKNGTSGVRIQKRWPIFVANYPKKVVDTFVWISLSRKFRANLKIVYFKPFLAYFPVWQNPRGLDRSASWILDLVDQGWGLRSDGKSWGRRGGLRLADLKNPKNPNKKPLMLLLKLVV